LKGLLYLPSMALNRRRLCNFYSGLFFLQSPIQGQSVLASARRLMRIINLLNQYGAGAKEDLFRLDLSVVTLN
jgi:hypothetical protein